MVACSSERGGELVELNQRKSELDQRVTTSLDERNALLAKVGSVRTAQAAQIPAELVGKIAEKEKEVLAMRRKLENAEAGVAEANRMLETLKSR
ncbi:MAG: hypothetical protein ACKO2G_09440 [Verrucomicrobiales bacterium]